MNSLIVFNSSGDQGRINCCASIGIEAFDRSPHKKNKYLHGAFGLVVGIVRHIGRRVEELADAVAAVSLNDAALVRSSYSGNGFTAFPESINQNLSKQQ